MNQKQNIKSFKSVRKEERMAIFMSTFLNISDRMLYYLLHDNVAGHQVFFTIYFL